MRHVTGWLFLMTTVVACSTNAGSERTSNPDTEQRTATDRKAASGGAESAARCVLSSADAVYLGEAPVYRDCGVDRKARLAQNVPVDFRPAVMARSPSRTDVCYVAEVEFIVDPEGVPERNSIRLVRTTDSAYGNAVLSTITKLRYDPALKDGMPVRQLVQERRVMAVRAAPVVSNPGARPNC